MPTETGLRLLSALRSNGGTSALRDVPETFFVDEAERTAFNWLRNYVNEYRAFPTVATLLRHTGINTVRTTEPLNYYIDRARKEALYTQLLEPFGNMREAMESLDPDAVIAAALQMQQVNAGLASRANEYISLQAAMESVVADYRIASENMAMRGITCGWDAVDAVTDGWQQDDLISVVGRPGIGKTYLLLYMAWQAWLAGYSVLFVSMELGAVQLARRLFGLNSRINPTLIRKGQISTSVRAQIENQLSGFGTISNVPFNIIQGGFRKSVQTVASVAEATMPDIVFVDASYLLAPEKKAAASRRETVSETIESLKKISIDLHRPVVQSLQFNRSAERQSTKEADSEQEGNNRNSSPTSHLSLAKIGETDVVGQASSIVIGAAAPPKNQPQDTRYCAFLKGREGETGTFQINYSFNPVDMSLIQFGNDNAPRQRANRTDLNYDMT